MITAENVLLLPDYLYKSDTEAPSLAPELIRTAEIPFYDANFFFSKLKSTLGMLQKYGRIKKDSPLSFIGSGRTGETFRLKTGDKDLAIKLMSNSRLSPADIQAFLNSQDPSAPDQNFSLKRLTDQSMITSNRNIYKNIAGSLIGHQLFPHYIDKPEFILTNQGQIIGFATRMIIGEPFSLSDSSKNGNFPLKSISERLVKAGVELDMAINAENGIRCPDGNVKLIDISLANPEILNKSWQEIVSAQS